MMRYVFYILTMVILFVAGMIVGNLYLPDQSAARSAAVSVPDLPQDKPLFQELNRQSAQDDLAVLNQALSSCPVVVGNEKDRLVNRIQLLLSINEFELKKAQLEMEMAKNIDTNRPTAQFTQATANYKEAFEAVTKMADELFPTGTTQSSPLPAEQATPDAPAQ